MSRTLVFVVMQSPNRADGGVESISQVIERLEELPRIVVTQTESRYTQRWRNAGAKVQVWSLPYAMNAEVTRAGLGRKWERLRGLAQTNLRSRSLVRSLGASVVHCNDIFGFMHAGFGAKSAGASVVLNVRDTKPGAVYRPHWRLAYKLSAATVVLSREMGRMLAGGLHARQPEKKIRPIYSIVDFSGVDPVLARDRAALRGQLGIDEDRLAVGVVGVVSEKKAQLALIEQALPALRAKCPGCHVYFIGDCDPAREPYAARCQERVRDLGLGGFATFVGYTDRVQEWYRALDVTVIASVREGLARAMIESLAFGTPVVSFDVCSAREILEEPGCGSVVPQGDYPALVQQVTMLWRDAGRRRALGERGAALTRELFAPSRVVAQYESLYHSLGGSARNG